MQPRILHLMEQLGRHPHSVPASNVVFVRTAREADLQRDKAHLLAACWPVHQAVIDQLGVRTVLCLGGTAGAWTREKLGATKLVGEWAEQNRRGWKALAHENEAGQRVVTLPHPSIAAWNVTETDPSDFVRTMIDRDS